MRFFASKHVSDSTKHGSSKTTLVTGFIMTLAAVIVLGRIGLFGGREEVRGEFPGKLAS